MFKKASLKIGRLSFLLATFLILCLIYSQVIFSFGFTDEGDNISIGKYLLEGKVLYRDLFSQHQPLTYYFSSFIQKLSQPSNILMVVQRHRQAVMIFSYLWIAFLIFRFGFWVWLPLVIFELTKYYLLGHLFLAESLVAYPLIYLTLLALGTAQRHSLKPWDAFLASVSVFFVVFNLLPLAPLAFFFLAYFVWKARFKKGVILIIVLPVLLSTLFLFLFLPIRFYFEDVAWANLFYYIPLSNKIAFQVEESRLMSLAKIFLYPLTSFFNLNNPYFRVLALITLIFILSSIFLTYRLKRFKLVIFSIFLLSLANLRAPVGTGIFYHAFHSLPYLGILIILTFILLKKAASLERNLSWKAFLFLPLFLLLAIFLFDQNYFYREKISSQETAYIQFSKIFDYSVGVKTLAAPGDTLAVFPYEELLYWYADIQPATRFLFYFSWVYDVPKFKKEIDQAFSQKPPTFIYWPIERLYKLVQEEDYFNLPRDATSSALFIHKNKVPQISEEQWQTLEYYRFGRIIKD